MAKDTYVRSACALATRSPCNMLHAAIIYRGGAIMAAGYNSHKCHAEVAAVQQFKRRYPELTLGGMKMLTIRVSRGGHLRLGKPCHKCQQFLVAVGLRIVYYSTERGLEKL